jgi:hypothetical protein
MELLKRFRDWFVSGLAFSLAVLGVTLAWQMYFKELVTPAGSYSVQSPQDIEIMSVEPVSVTKSAGVTATLRNKSTSVHYKPSGYELVYFEGNKRIGSCSAYEERPDLKPGSTGQVQILCQEIERTALPATATFKLSVRSAWRFY